MQDDVPREDLASPPLRSLDFNQARETLGLKIACHVTTYKLFRGLRLDQGTTGLDTSGAEYVQVRRRRRRVSFSSRLFWGVFGVPNHSLPPPPPPAHHMGSSTLVYDARDNRLTPEMRRVRESKRARARESSPHAALVLGVRAGRVRHFRGVHARRRRRARPRGGDGAIVTRSDSGAPILMCHAIAASRQARRVGAIVLEQRRAGRGGGRRDGRRLKRHIDRLRRVRRREHDPQLALGQLGLRPRVRGQNVARRRVLGRRLLRTGERRAKET